jgi:hypothetical protein
VLLEGTQQGCVLAMLLFSLAIQPTVIDNTSVCELRVNIWEADDGTLFGRISEVAKALERISGAEDTGYLMRLEKTLAWNHAISAPLRRALGCRLLMSDAGAPNAGLVLLRSPVGLPSFVHSFMNGKNAEMERLAVVRELRAAALVPQHASAPRYAAPSSNCPNDSAGATRCPRWRLRYLSAMPLFQRDMRSRGPWYATGTPALRC